MVSRPLLAVLFLLVGCTSDSSPADTSATDDAAVPEAIAPEPASQATPALAVDAGGLSELTPTGLVAPLPFGLEGERVVAVVQRLLGDPTERGTNAECGAGPLAYATWDGGLTLWLQDDRFVGWALDGADRRLTTVTGLAIGSTRADLDAAPSAPRAGSATSVIESTLGTEFDADGLFGLLSGPGPDATVTTLWAGVSCTFR